MRKFAERSGHGKYEKTPDPGQEIKTKMVLTRLWLSKDNSTGQVNKKKRRKGRHKMRWEDIIKE